jgi:hypothetical protein
MATSIASSSIAPPQSLPWYLKDLTQSCDDIIACSQGDEDEEEVTDSYSRYQGPLHFEDVSSNERAPEDEYQNCGYGQLQEQEMIDVRRNISTVVPIASQQPYNHCSNVIADTMEVKEWYDGTPHKTAAFGVVLSIVLLLAIGYALRKEDKSRSNPCESKKDVTTPKISASQKRRKRRRQKNGRQIISHSDTVTSALSDEGENDTSSAFPVQAKTLSSSDQQQESLHETRQEKDNSINNDSPIYESSSPTMNYSTTTKAIEISKSTTNVVNPHRKSDVIWSNTATPLCFNYNEHVQMIASVVSSTGLDTTTSLTLANQTMLRRYETQFMLHQQQQQLQQPTEGIPSVIGIYYFKPCLVISILVRSAAHIYRYYDYSHRQSNILSTIYNYSATVSNNKMSISSIATIFFMYMCGCASPSNTETTIATNIAPQDDNYYFYNLLSYYYNRTKGPSVVSTLLQMQCWAFCLIPSVISLVALYLLHRLLEMFHSPKQVHHLVNLIAFLVLFSFYDIVLRLTVLHTFLLLGTNLLMYILRRVACNKTNLAMIKNAVLAFSLVFSILLGFTVY